MPLYNNIVGVKGYKRSLFIDLQTEKYIFVNNTTDILQNNYHLLQQNQFLLPETLNTWIDNFPAISMDNYQRHFYNGIVDIEKYSLSILDLICDFLISLNCNSIQIRFLADFEDNEINTIINCLSKLYMLENIEIVMSEVSLTQTLINYVNSIPYHTIGLYNVENVSKSNQYKIYTYNPFDTSKIFFSFYFNKQFFIEANQCNPYFLNKIYIDKTGFIYNSPETIDEKIGYLPTNTFESVKRHILSYFNHSHNTVSKSKIQICVDCELRYSCMDNRKIEHNNGIYWHLFKCIYNPYICKWAGQEGYVPVEECGSYSRETGFVPNHEKIKILNKQIWDDNED